MPLGAIGDGFLCHAIGDGFVCHMRVPGWPRCQSGAFRERGAYPCSRLFVYLTGMVTSPTVTETISEGSRNWVKV